MTIIQAIESEDMADIIDRLVLYANSRLKFMGTKDFNGKEPCDFVGDLILKVMEGTRNWNSSKVSFKEFLFGCLKSEISNYVSSKRVVHISDLPENISGTTSWSDVEAERRELSNSLEKAGATTEELVVFEYWMDGIKLPREIAKDLGIDVKKIYTITESLKNRLEKLRVNLTI